MASVNAVPAALANRVLEREAWARQRLAAFAGRIFVVVVGPVATAMRVDDTGLVASTATGAGTPDLTLTLSPLDLPAFLANPTRWGEFVATEGDPALAATLQELAQTLPWFVEQAFAGALGPVIGQRLANAGRQLLAFPEYAAQRVGDSVASFARDEAGLLAHGEEARVFADQVAALAARTDALAARLDALASRLPPRGTASA
jgi:ubiquinone biosynthesis protein UbiJ